MCLVSVVGLIMKMGWEVRPSFLRSFRECVLIVQELAAAAAAGS